jgi:WD40 repeat protein
LIAEDNAEKNITHLLYNHQYTRLIIGLADASLIILSITAEPSQEAEDDGDPLKDRGEEDQQEGKVTIIDADATKLGPYQKGAITFIKEIKSVHVLITGCESGKIVFWDIIKRDVICSYPLLGNITSGDLSANDQLLAVGTDNGVVRILNIANIRKPVLLKLIKLYKGKPISNVLFSPTQDTIAVSSVNSPKIYFLSVKALNLIGYTELPITCNGIAWN